MAEYIERDAVLAEYDRQHKGPPGGARKIIAEWPAADVAPVRHGRWEWDDIREVYICSECHRPAYGSTLEIISGDYKFCPRCGAKMTDEEETNPNV